MSEILHNRTRRNGSGYVIRRENDGRVMGTLIDPSPRTWETSRTTRYGYAALHSAITTDLTGVLEEHILSEFFYRVAEVKL